MGRPRKIAAAAVAPASAPVAADSDSTANNAIFFDEEEAAEGSSGGEGEPVASVAATDPPAQAAQPDLSLFLKEMQLLRETMQSQRTQLDTLHHQRVREQQEADMRVRSLQQQLVDMQQQLQQTQSLPAPPPVPVTTTPEVSAFRSTAPSLPRQQPVAPPLARTTSFHSQPVITGRTHARLGLTGDLPNTSKQHQGHMTEMKLGSRYIIKGSNGLS